MTYPIVGSCQCGQVTYKLCAAPKMVIACHCKECQKLSTAPFSVTAIIATEAIQFDGELTEWGRLADSGNQNSAKFCSTCGNRVYQYNPDDLTTIKLKLKPVDVKDDRIFEPSMHIWVSEKLSWVQIPKGMVTFDKQR